MTQIDPLSTGFPQITAPFTKNYDIDGNVVGYGMIERIWLQLLIALWQRTGAAPGADTIEALIVAYANEQDFVTSSQLLQQIDSAIAGIGIPNPLLALLAMDASGSGTATPVDVDDTSWVPLVDGSEPPNFITDGAGKLIFVSYTP